MLVLFSTFGNFLPPASTDSPMGKDAQRGLQICSAEFLLGLGVRALVSLQGSLYAKWSGEMHPPPPMQQVRPDLGWKERGPTAEQGPHSMNLHYMWQAFGTTLTCNYEPSLFKNFF